MAGHLMSNGGSFMEAHRDFVLKLKFVGAGDDTQVRRIRLPRIANGQGEVSYDELVGLAISFIIPAKPVDISDFEVKLTYKDVDEDTVVIGSSEELIDAIDQYAEQRVLRISAEIKSYARAPAQQKQQPQRTCENNGSPSRASSHRPSHDTGVQTGTATSGAKITQPTPVLQHVVESVVNIILNAAVAINGRQGGNQHQASDSPNLFYSPDGTPVDSPEPTTSSPDVAQGANITEDATPESLQTDATDEEQKPAAAVAPSTESKQTNKADGKVSAEKPAAEEKTEETRPFIHGRHTCDICLTTPIVGKRFHAKNLPDYDLCQRCHDNYNGNEIEFEAVELDRDRNLQDRWHRRRDRMNAKGGGCGPVGRGRRFGPNGHHKRWGPGPHRGPPGPPPPRGHPPAPYPPGPHRHGPPGPPFPPGPFHPHHHGPPHRPFPPPPPPHGDLGMEEAIRRSLEDMMKHKKPAPTSEPSVPAEENAPAANEESATNVLSGAEEPPAEAAIVAKVEETPSLLKPAAVPNLKAEPEPAPVNAEPQLSAPSAPLEEEVRSFSSIGSGVSSHKGSSASKSDKVKVETVVDEDGEEEFVVDAQKVEGRSFSWSSSPAREEPSFSSDAAGSGDVAVSLGETLDKCAKAIDAMVLELGRSASVESASSSFIGVEDNDEPESVASQEEDYDELVEDAEAEEETQEEAEDGEETQKEAGAGEETQGATIVESSDGIAADADGNSAASRGDHGEEEWQVVNENHQISSDEDLARAAQMIGSALFNSDMRSSGEMLSTLTGSGADEISCVSSVPTCVHSVASVSQAQLERWVHQLEQLHTIGIDDDARCIEILERLTAANIGCGSSDEVSVQQVVNELWK